MCNRQSHDFIWPRNCSHAHGAAEAPFDMSYRENAALRIEEGHSRVEGVPA